MLVLCCGALQNRPTDDNGGAHRSQAACGVSRPVQWHLLHHVRVLSGRSDGRACHPDCGIIECRPSIWIQEGIRRRCCWSSVTDHLSLEACPGACLPRLCLAPPLFLPAGFLLLPSVNQMSLSQRSLASNDGVTGLWSRAWSFTRRTRMLSHSLCANPTAKPQPGTGAMPGPLKAHKSCRLSACFSGQRLA